MGRQIFDQYTFLHFAVGIITYFWGISLTNWFIFHTIFELTENTTAGMTFINRYLTFWPGGKPYADSRINSVGDTIGAIIGWYSAYLLDYYGNKYGFYQKHL